MLKENKLIMIIFAIIFPPLAVYFQKGLGKDLVINIVLLLFFFLPAMVHALWLISKG